MKKIWIGVIVVVALTSLSGIYYWRVASNRRATPDTIAPTPKEEALSEWKDPAGFAFSYPKSLTVDKHEKDEENYAHIEFTHSDNPGTIILWAKDLPAGKPGTTGNASTWIQSDKSLASGTIFDTTLADMAGKKVILTTPKRKIVTAVVTDAIVFSIEGEFENNDFWTKTYDTIVSTFTFIPLAGESDNRTTEETNETFVDEEEVLE